VEAFMRKVLPLVIVAGVLAPMLAGCVYVGVAAGVAAVSAARQERTIGNAVDDIRIKTELSQKLVDNSADNFVNVSSTVIEGRVLLTGRVTSPETRLDATRIAWSIEGVRKVDNDIEVTEDGQWLNRPMDIYIRTKLSADLLADLDIHDVNYTIDVVNGVVFLTGVGQDQAEIEAVIAHARDIPQVTRVENYVVLKTDPIRYGMAAATRPTHAPSPPPAGDDAPPAAAPSREPIEVTPVPPPPATETADRAPAEATGAPTPLH
jgi:osmotically-inducible protein OsmY